MQDNLTSQINIRRVEKSKIESLDFDNIQFGKVFTDHMLIMDYKDGEWGIPDIKPFEPLVMHPATSVLHYGQSIFEGLKAYKNDQDDVFVFRPEQNAKRLNVSAARMCMPSVPEDVFVDAIKQLVSIDSAWIPKKRGSSLYIRPLLFATDEYIGVKPSNTYRLMIFMAPVDKYYSGAVKVKIEEHFSRSVRGGTGFAKAAGNYAASLYPAKLAQEEGFDQLVWTDAIEHKYIEESGTMNIMFRSGNKIFSPKVSDSILSGITRDSILKLADKWGYEVEEKMIEVQEIVNHLENGTLDEVFGAGTAATIARIESIGYRGKIYKLQDVNDWEFSNRASDFLESLKRGEQEDSFGWVHKVL
ncbi:MAG: branched-chain amino acid aminotransferase [Flavobacteriales bacterium]|jgi:branched-chain amino acid aminotransferase|tara:strand:+ start:1168 stop:2241 length:1074 start_codon:yes stop_codon:yes gene_type:complete